MRIIYILTAAWVFLSSCSNSSDSGALFCDTTCSGDSLRYKGEGKFEPFLAIGFNKCRPDTVVWGHYLMNFNKQLDLIDFLGQEIRMNEKAVSCVIRDTVEAWLTFNDCITGRGYLLKLPFSKTGITGKYTGALNDFDPKFSVAPDLRAYTDRGSIFVINIQNGKEATMSFKEAYDIDFNKIHEVVDSVNVTNKRIYVKLLKNGQEVPMEKAVEL